MIRWISLLFWKGFVLAVRRVQLFGRQFRRWLMSKDGAVFMSAFALVLVFGGLWILDRLDEMVPGMDRSDTETVDTTSDEPANPVVARVGSQPITLEDILEFARQDGKLARDERLTLEEVLDRNLVRDAVDQTLLARAAADAGLVAEPDVRARLTAARNRILAAAFLERRLAEEVTPEAARELYQIQRRQMIPGSEVTVREIVVPDAETALEVKLALDGGMAFTEAVTQWSVAPSAQSFGSLGSRPLRELPPEYAQRAEALATGTHSQPFETEQGWVILRMEERQRVTLPGYSNLEDELLEFLRLKTIDDTMQRLHEEARVQIIEEDDDPLTGLPADAAREPAALRN